MTLLRPADRAACGGGASSAPNSGRDRRFTSAGQVLGVSLLCFSLWLLLDARQLYNSARDSPLGTRRSVAMSVLRPIARVTSALSLDRLVDGANETLGRTTPSSPGVASRPRPARHHHLGLVTPATVPSSSSLGPAPLTQPSAAHPLTVLEVGDSLGEDLGYGLANVVGANPAVHVIQDAVESTGLANVGYYNWRAVLSTELQRYRPRLVVVMLGGNDTQNFMVGERGAAFGTSFWQEQYGARVGAMMREATRAGAQVIWVGMPVMASSAMTSQMATLDDVFEVEAEEHPGVTYLSTWKLFENRLGLYSEYLPDANGNLVAVRAPDGVHIVDPGGDNLVATAVLDDVERLWNVAVVPGIHRRPAADVSSAGRVRLGGIPLVVRRRLSE